MKEREGEREREKKKRKRWLQGKRGELDK